MNHWIYGILNLPWWGYVIATLVMTHITIVCVTLFLHRSQAHRACDFHPIISHFFRFWLWLTTGMETKAWVAIHRKHHATSDTPDDPHSPQVEGIGTLLVDGAELYRNEARNEETLKKFSHGVPDDWVERNIYTPYSAKGILIMLFLDLLFLGVPGLTVWAIQMIWIPFFACGVINGIGHYWGYRNYECADAATNIIPWGILIGGEELHNNHHTFGTSAKLSAKWFEFDIGWLYLNVMKFFGLATIKKLPPKPAFAPGKTTIDGNTIKGIFSNRFQVLSQYTKRVTLPVFNEEKSKADSEKLSLLNKAKQPLVRDEYLVDEQAKACREQAMSISAQLKSVFELRQAFQAIWKKAMPQADLVTALQEWCAQAEATGIDALKDFVSYLKTYTVAEPQKA